MSDGVGVLASLLATILGMVLTLVGIFSSIGLLPDWWHDPGWTMFFGLLIAGPSSIAFLLLISTPTECDYR